MQASQPRERDERKLRRRTRTHLARQPHVVSTAALILAPDELDDAELLRFEPERLEVGERAGLVDAGRDQEYLDADARACWRVLIGRGAAHGLDERDERFGDGAARRGGGVRRRRRRRRRSGRDAGLRRSECSATAVEPQLPCLADDGVVPRLVVVEVERDEGEFEGREGLEWVEGERERVQVRALQLGRRHGAQPAHSGRLRGGRGGGGEQRCVGSPPARFVRTAGEPVPLQREAVSLLSPPLLLDISSDEGLGSRRGLRRLLRLRHFRIGLATGSVP